MNYNFLFLWIAFMALAAKSGVSYLTTENGYEQVQVTKRFANIVFIPIIVFVVTSTWRYWGDYGMYLGRYNSFPINVADAINTIKAEKDCYLFYVLTYVVKVLSGGNTFIYRLVLAVIQTIPFVYIYRKYSNNYVFSVFLFLANGIPLGWMLNGVRQLIAAAIIYAATPIIIEKRYIKVICIILVASLFHQSAVIMLPIVFLSQGKAWSTKTMLALLGSVVLAVLFSTRTGSFDSIAESMGYDMNLYAIDDGVHPLRVLVHFVPVFLAFLGKEELETDESPEINYFINMSVISFGIYLIGMVTNGVLVGRIPLYTSLYNFILLPYLFERMFQKSGQGLLYFASTILYSLFFVVQFGIR